LEKIAEFKNRLKEALQNSGLTQSELAREIGVNRSNVSQWLNGRSDTKPDTFRMLAKVLGVSSLWLEGYDVPMREEKRDYFYEKVEMLNDEGRKKVEIYIDDLLDNPKYKKHPAVVNPPKVA
jgi:transcriptional regulator with XRE-family HTH domain